MSDAHACDKCGGLHWAREITDPPGPWQCVACRHRAKGWTFRDPHEDIVMRRPLPPERKT
jgi:ribosomal protein L37AE/L43A